MQDTYQKWVVEIREFLRLESSAGILLFVAAILALIASNSFLEPIYRHFLDIPVTLRVGRLSLDKPLLLWINDGLMAVFFLLVGLEIKRELVEGELSTPAQALLPAIAAIGGMAVPAALYLAVVGDNPIAQRGWAIPAATDIAFALGVMALLGNRVPASLKIFLLALAIFDDLGAIVVIALFYSGELSWTSLGLAAIAISTLFLLNRFGVTRLAAYMVVGVILWICVLKSGVHATLAGVITALFVPIAARDGGGSPLKHLEHTLHPWVAYLVLPLFGFANAGVALGGLNWGEALGGVSAAIAVGLFLGKQIGIFGASFLAVKLGIAKLPEGASWLGLYGTAIVAGIGFTMSLFIGTLAWEDAAFATPVRIGVLAGSLASGIVGYLLLAWVYRGGRTR